MRNQAIITNDAASSSRATTPVAQKRVLKQLRRGGPGRGIQLKAPLQEVGELGRNALIGEWRWPRAVDNMVKQHLRTTEKTPDVQQQ
jgi:hypothetical protein